MKWFGLCLVLFTLSSCATHTVSHNIADNTINQITALEQSIDEKCATNAIKTQINVIKSQIKAINDACDTEKAELRAEKTKWQWAFWALLTLVVLYTTRKVIK